MSEDRGGEGWRTQEMPTSCFSLTVVVVVVFCDHIWIEDERHRERDLSITLNVIY